MIFGKKKRHIQSLIDTIEILREEIERRDIKILILERNLKTQRKMSFDLEGEIHALKRELKDIKEPVVKKTLPKKPKVAKAKKEEK